MRPAMALMVVFDVGVLYANCCCEARFWSVVRSAVVNEADRVVL